MSDKPDEVNPTELPSTEAAPSSSGGSKKIGPYRLLQKLGEGGMGEVWLAEQTKPVKRRVALKIIKQGMDTKQVVARFEAERQALAMMDHPAVAKVFDAGTTPRGRPYFVMEYVKGVPINEHCDRHKLTNHERLELFLRVCEGVQHAHQKAIIHRDLKPSNVLVTEQDGRRLPKIIDFGVAKATAQKLTEKTMFTQLGVLIGTPEYMSPEQAELTGEDVDTRTDVYSLGVILYELLVGALPFDSKELRSGGFEGIRKKIREEEPHKPSTRLSTLGDQSTESAKRRRVDLSTLLRQLRGDLDWITMKALEKDRTRRYGSPQELAADIERHLTDQPVLASSPGTAYRLGKFVRRHRLGVAASGLVVLALVLGMGATVFGLVRARRAEARTLAERNRAETQSYLANLRAAEASIRLHETKEAKRRLEACRPELRAWEWWHLKGQTDSSVAVFSGHEGWIAEIARSPDGSRIASASYDCTVRIWDTNSGRCLDVLRHEPKDSYLTVAFSPDGSRIATGDFSSRVQLWDAISGEQLRTMVAPEPVMSVAFSPDGNRIAAGSWDESFDVWKGSVNVWDARTGQSIPEFQRPETEGRARSFLDCAFTPDGASLITAEIDMENAEMPSALRVWDAATGRIRHSIGLLTRMASNGAMPVITGFALSPDGSRVALAVSETIQLRDPVSGDLQMTLEGHEQTVRAVAFSDDGALVASGACDNTVRVWDARAGTPIAELIGHDDCVNSVVFDRTASYLFTGSGDGSVRRWESEQPPAGIPHVATLLAVAFSPDGKRIATGGQDGIIRVFDVESRELVFASSDAPQKIWSVTFDADGSRIASGHLDGAVRIWNAANGESIVASSGDEAYVSRVVFSADGALVASSLAGPEVRPFADGVTRIRDSVTGADVATLEGRAPVFHPDGTRIITATREDLIVWDTATAERTDAIAGTGVTALLVLSPDGERILTGVMEELRLRDLSGRHDDVVFVGHDGWIRDAAFGPAGQRLVSGANDETVRVWDTTTGDLLLTLRADSAVLDVDFSADGRRVVAACGDGIARIWETPAEYRPVVNAVSSP